MPRTTLQTPAQDVATFDAALTINQAVEARWTNAGHTYTATAHVKRVNARSIAVLLDATMLDVDDAMLYPAGYSITLPRLGTKNYSSNHGAYPIGEDVEPATLSDTVLEDEYASEVLEESVQQEDIATWDDTTDAERSAAATHREENEDVDPSLPGLGKGWLYTTAPADLDLEGTHGVALVGTLAKKRSRGVDTYRKVRLSFSRISEQATVYGENQWNVHTPAEFAELLDMPSFQARFVPTGMSVSLVENLGAGGDACDLLGEDALSEQARQDAYRDSQHHTPVNTDEDPTLVHVVATPLSQEETLAGEDETHETDTQTPETALNGAVSAPAFATKVEYLMALVAQGADAVAMALRQGHVSVKTRTPGRTNGTAPRAKLSLDIARAVRQRLAVGEKAQALADELHVHYTTILDINAKRIWKEPATA